MRQTKIVATISDKRCEKEFIQSLFDAGMNVARINTAHITPESGKEMVKNIKAVSDKIAILIDTKGPEIRTCSLQSEIDVNEGQIITISYKETKSEHENVCVNYRDFAKDCKPGDRILFDDGDIEVTVEEKKRDVLFCRVNNNGRIKNKKSVNIPGVATHLPSLSDRDKEFIRFAEENEIDFIAHSFVRNEEDIFEVQKFLDSINSPIKLIAKIENLEGVEKIDEILEHSYGIMVARGDLGIELPAEKIPTVQRNLIRKAIVQKKPVIIATQMLHSMIENPRPTRAEVNDVASAVYSRADAIMLSGETAMGKYPVESVKTMERVALEVEPDRDKRYDVIIPPTKKEIPAYLAHSAIRTAKELEPKAIITSTTTGRTARYLAAYRSDIPVYAKCHSQRVVRELALSFGIIPSFLEMKKDKMKIQKAAFKTLVADNTITSDDLVIYVGGRFGEDCGASFIEISTVDKIIPKD
ncbi:pyruvate kinase [Tangfeifania diversioriginum]|uniref:Pyruvate kinase n=1 Tax=Tangfeifania diversioriginum TaxID=1168035 RepID=A0A1M6CQH1_9BACT|nr:pyruvate kinase [Tangfeifania diversioriginum]SHI63267.1 pyruvate kinase [Tangfeifania diversioriginum]